MERFKFIDLRETYSFLREKVAVRIVPSLKKRPFSEMHVNLAAQPSNRSIAASLTVIVKLANRRILM